MTDGDWNDDSDYRDAVRRADRAERTGWRLIAGTTGLIGLVLVILAVVCVVAVVAGLYLVMTIN
ncbi:hypothetical protein AB0G87_11695 [Streptomyces asoensis]|uniref:hypothetical protein n=1 Tax=Streptomyces asoensis TaxID=249586 RepID=UPI0033DA85A5